MHISGECFCGDVKYQVDGELKDTLSCHCSRCRKAFSSQASAYAFVNPDKFKWLAGEELLSAYVGKHGWGYQFCKVCGSTVCGILNGKIHGIMLGCVNGDPEVKLDAHIFVGSKAVWETIPKGVPQFAEGRPQKD